MIAVNLVATAITHEDEFLVSLHIFRNNLHVQPISPLLWSSVAKKSPAKARGAALDAATENTALRTLTWFCGWSISPKSPMPFRRRDKSPAKAGRAKGDFSEQAAQS
jgi:hypothetical protein